MAALGLDDRELSGYLHTLRDLGERKAQIHGRGLAHRKHDVVLGGRLKTRGFHTDIIGRGREASQTIFAMLIAQDSATDSFGRVSGRHFGFGYGRSGWIRNRSDDVGGGAHALRMRCGCK